LSKRAQGVDDSLKCSFCHKSQDLVGKLISSPSPYPRAYICDECIAVCNAIMEDDIPDAKPATPGPTIEEIQNLRRQLCFQLEHIPYSDLGTVAKILQALIQPRSVEAIGLRRE
jgi:hypothetical protein